MKQVMFVTCSIMDPNCSLHVNWMYAPSTFCVRELLILMNVISAPKVHLMNMKIYVMYIQTTCNDHLKCI